MQANSRYLGIDFSEQELRVKNLTSVTENEQAYKLRHKIFADELRWILARADGLDIDNYDDDRMAPLGVFDQESRLIAHLRITLPQRTFMMEKEFDFLIEEPITKTTGTVEVSRVCTEMDTRKTIIKTDYGRFHYSMLLYKGLYQWCQLNSVNEIYMVIECKLLRLLNLSGFHCRKIGAPTIMPDGVSAVAVKIDWRIFENINKSSKPQLISWYKNIEMKRLAA